MNEMGKIVNTVVIITNQIASMEEVGVNIIIVCLVTYVFSIIIIADCLLTTVVALNSNCVQLL